MRIKGDKSAIDKFTEAVNRQLGEGWGSQGRVQVGAGAGIGFGGKGTPKSVYGGVMRGGGGLGRLG